MTDEVIEVYKRHIDLTMIRRSLQMTPEERIQRLEQMAILREEFLKNQKTKEPADER